jgi:molybdopterin converting factor small subunit
MAIVESEQRLSDTFLRVEFFGIPRQRAGAAEAAIPLPSPTADLGDLLGELTFRFPGLVGECLEPGGRLAPACIANLDGDRFVRDPATPLAGVSTVLLLSADAGG